MKKILSLVLALAMVMSLALIAHADEPAGELVLYTTVSELQYGEIVGAFEAKYPNIKVTFTKAGAGECKSRILNEKDNPQADAMFGGLVYADIATLDGCLEYYVAANDAALPEDMRNATGYLTYHDSQIPCLWVNDELEAEAGVTVTSYADLLNPALEAQVVSADPTESSSAWNQLQCILTDFGGWESQEAWDYIRALNANKVVIIGSSSGVYKGVMNGEYTVGMTYEPACVQNLSEGVDNCHIVYPTEGVTSIAFGSAIIKGAKNLTNAQLFMDFLISDEGQALYNKCGARQANANLVLAEPNPYIVDLNTIKYNVADTKALADNQPAIHEMWRAIFK